MCCNSVIRSSLVRTVVSVALLGASAAAHSLVIDDFSSGNFQGGTFSNFYQAYRATSTGTMAGGQRGTLSNYNDGFRVGDGVYHYSSNIQYNAPGVYDPATQPEPGTHLIYGSSPGFAFPALDLDLSSFSGVDITFPSIADSLTVSMFVQMFNGETAYAEVTKTANASVLPSVVNLPFTDANTEGPIDWANVVSLQFSFYDNGNPIDIAVDRIDAVSLGVSVPEPGSLALLAGGLALLLVTRANVSRTARR